MTRRELIASLGTAAAGRAANPSRPNVLFIYSDDQRADTIAAHGNPHIRTPNLDRLASRGVSFRGHYIFGSNNGAVCVPSRAMLMSGRTWFDVDAPTLKGASSCQNSWARTAMSRSEPASGTTARSRGCARSRKARR